MKTIAVKDIYASRASDIEPGEELTIDYAATAVDQFAGQDFWVLDCKCGSANCRGRVSGDFFELPEELQRRYYPQSSAFHQAQVLGAFSRSFRGTAERRRLTRRHSGQRLYRSRTEPILSQRAFSSRVVSSTHHALVWCKSGVKIEQK